MTLQKQPLQEVASSVEAHKVSRSEPMPQAAGRMDFIKSLILDIPMQVYTETPDTPMNIEKIIEAHLDAEARKLEKPDTTDHVSFDIPLLIRILEHAREGLSSDVELHDFVERIIAIREKGILSMDDYETIAGGDIEGTDKENAPRAYAGQQQQGESIDSLRKLAGIR